MKISTSFSPDNECTVFHGDCASLLSRIPDESVDLIVTSPPYCMGKAYEKASDNLDTFTESHKQIMPEMVRVLKPGASLCWQVGYHIKNGVITPLDFTIYDLIANHEDESVSNGLVLRNRIIWTFGHGLNAKKRFSGRHETILWYTKGDDYSFDLDSVRIPQKYPGKKYYKGSRKGEYSCNPKGKNPSDVWDIPNVKANHIEKTGHPCQFPIAVPQRLIKALTKKGDFILDPFMGSGTTGAAAIIEGRRFAGAEIMLSYQEIALQRIFDASNGNLAFRADAPVEKPNRKNPVAQKPKEWS